MKGAHLLNIVIPCQRFQETISFYRDVLKLEPIHEAPSHYFLRAGGVNLGLHPANDEQFAPTGRGIYLDLCVPSLAKAKEALPAHIPVIKEWADANGQFLLVADPEGNLLELIELP